jgi:CBS domain containing-hemolysin-like protein
MVSQLVIAVVLTIGVSALCSILEAMVLSLTTAEIENFKKQSPQRGKLIEKYRNELEETSSAILSLNTIANTLGATLAGGLAEKTFGDGSNSILLFAGGMTLGILFFSEILPKNLTVIYRADMIGFLVLPLLVVRLLMSPFSKICKFTMKAMVPSKEKSIEEDEEEIILLARKGAKEGTLSEDESDWVTNALRLDGVKVSEIMTPRTVMLALEENTSVQKVFDQYPNVPFARIPVYADNIDHITGIVRRRDLHNAMVEEKANTLLKDLAYQPLFIPENASADKALRLLLAEHAQLSVSVDEFGSVAGVLAMEDIIESILGQEIFEHDDLAVDMRELAKRKHVVHSSEQEENSSSQRM